jgi:flagellar export protein FliJ
MKKFAFPLDRLRQLRKAKLEQQEERMRRLLIERLELERQKNELDEQELSARERVRELRVVSVDELQAVDAYRRFAERERLRLRSAEGELVSRIERQREALLAAQRDVEALNSLREQRLNTWRIEVDKEIENTVAELVVARWNREEK